MTVDSKQTAQTDDRQWVVIDAEGRTLGRLATQIATILRGKHKPEFAPNLDCGDGVIVVNAGKIRVTGRKLEQKYYYRHSGYPGGLKSVRLDQLLEKKPEQVIRRAVRGMLPDSALSRSCFRRLRVYAGAEHPHGAQRPVVVE
jgi:large subunit ribosomal protein L13